MTHKKSTGNFLQRHQARLAIGFDSQQQIIPAQVGGNAGFLGVQALAATQFVQQAIATCHQR